MEDEDRVTRMTTYMMMVSVDMIKHNPGKANKTFVTILKENLSTTSIQIIHLDLKGQLLIV